MFRNRLFNLSCLSLALLTVVQLSKGAILLHANHELNVKSAPIELEAVGSGSLQQPEQDGVPDQGRPVGRLRGGSSR